MANRCAVCNGNKSDLLHDEALAGTFHHKFEPEPISGEASRPSTFPEMEVRATVALDGTRRACNNENCLKDYGHAGLCDGGASTVEQPPSQLCPCGCGQIAVEFASTPQAHEADDCTCEHCIPAARPVSGTEPVQGDNVLQDGPVNRLHEALANAYKWNDERKKAAVSGTEPATKDAICDQYGFGTTPERGGTEESARPRLDIYKIAEECFNAPTLGNSSDGERIKAIAKVISKYLPAAAPGLTPRCPKCKSPLDEKCWTNGDRFLVCGNLHQFEISKTDDFTQFFSAQKEAGQ